MLVFKSRVLQFVITSSRNHIHLNKIIVEKQDERLLLSQKREQILNERKNRDQLSV